MENTKQKYTREELINLLDDLAKNLSIIRYCLENAVSETAKYKKTVELEELIYKYKHVLNPKYTDSAITVLGLKFYLETGQAETVEQAIALDEKGTPYTF